MFLYDGFSSTAHYTSAVALDRYLLTITNLGFDQSGDVQQEEDRFDKYYYIENN